MPLYEYRCPDGHITSDIRRICVRDEPCTCSTCGEAAKLIPSVARTYMKADGFQTSMPKRPGFDNLDYAGRKWPAQIANP